MVVGVAEIAEDEGVEVDCLTTVTRAPDGGPKVIVVVVVVVVGAEDILERGVTTPPPPAAGLITAIMFIAVVGFSRLAIFTSWRYTATKLRLSRARDQRQ